jgi:enolase
MIRNVRIFPVLNSRDETTIRTEIVATDGTYSATAPSGKSKGRYEAKAQPFGKIKKLFPLIKKKLVGLDEREFGVVDDALESLGINRIGGNLAIALSMAAVRAAGRGEAYAALGRIKSFPYPLGNVIGGGAHGGGLSLQEILVIPAKAKDVSTAVETNFAIWRAAGSELKTYGTTGRNDEGAWTSSIDEFRSLEIVRRVARRFGAKIGVDVASGQFYKNGKYRWSSIGRTMGKDEHFDFIRELIKKFGLIYVEDPFIENDWESFSRLTKLTEVLVCGDDLFATQPERLDIGIHRHAARATIIKPDQAGTISKTLRAIHMAKDAGIVPVVSHRSGETCDAFISDLAVATGTPLLKCGISGGERVAKANRLIELWDNIKKPKMTKLML